MSVNFDYGVLKTQQCQLHQDFGLGVVDEKCLKWAKFFVEISSSEANRWLYNQATALRKRWKFPITSTEDGTEDEKIFLFFSKNIDKIKKTV